MNSKYLSICLFAIAVLACTPHETDVTTPSDQMSPDPGKPENPVDPVDPVNPTDPVFHVRLENPKVDDTKVHVDKTLHIAWDADDHVTLFNRSANNQEWRFAGEAGEDAGDIQPVGDASAGDELECTYAIYPYREENGIDKDGVLSVSFPNEQHYRKQALTPQENLMVACTKGEDLYFRNLCGYLGVNLFGEDITVTSLSLKGNATERIAGPADVTVAEGGEPSVSVAQSPSAREIVLALDPPVKIGSTEETATQCWLAMPPTLFSKGISLTVHCVGGDVEVSTTESLTVDRNQLVGLGTIELERVWEYVPITVRHCLTFQSEGTTLLSLNNKGANAPHLYYSLDGHHWRKWGDTDISVSRGTPVYLCGDNPDGLSHSVSRYSTIAASGSRFSVSGNIMSLINAAEIVSRIPCSYCFYSLFRSCQLLQSAPDLPAKDLEPYCYAKMFGGCSRLASAPVLPATSLVNSCYNEMFEGCSSLNYIQALFITTPGTAYTNNWVAGVAEKGTFVKGEGALWDVVGVHGIPEGWDVIDPNPLEMEEDFPCELEYGPSLSLEENLSDLITVRTNKNPDKVRLAFHSDDAWLFVADNAMAVNGNPSVNGRDGVLYADVFYDDFLCASLPIDVHQSGVYAMINATSNISQFDIYAGYDPSFFTVGFTPYGGTLTIPFVSNCDNCLNPLSEWAFPQLMTGEDFVPEQSFPSVSGNKDALSFHYDSNPSPKQKGCLFNYVPLIYVVEDWANPESSYAPYYVDDGKGGALFLPFCTLQSPVYVFTEYSAYIADPVASLTSPEEPGFNRLKSYTDIANMVFEATRVRVYSNVKWYKSDLSLMDSSIPYRILNDVAVTADGKKMDVTDLDMFLRNTLTYTGTINGDRQYRPHEAHDSRWTVLQVAVDLLDGTSFLVPLADVGQPGVPHTTLPASSGSDCWEGSYGYNGNTYKYCVSFSVEIDVEMDQLTSFFCGTPQLKASAGGGVVKDYHQWNTLNFMSGYFGGTLYANGPCSIIYDWRVPMLNGVYVYSEYQARFEWDERTVTFYQTPKERPLPMQTDYSVRECRYIGKPSLAPVLPPVAVQASGRCSAFKQDCL